MNSWTQLRSLVATESYFLKYLLAISFVLPSHPPSPVPGREEKKISQEDYIQFSVLIRSRAFGKWRHRCLKSICKLSMRAKLSHEGKQWGLKKVFQAGGEVIQTGRCFCQLRWGWGSQSLQPLATHGKGAHVRYNKPQSVGSTAMKFIIPN